MELSLTFIYSWIAPILAPVTPAFMFGNNLYKGLIADGFDHSVALGASIAGTIGVEASGAFACAMGVKAFRNGDKFILLVSVICAVIYGIFVIVGVSTAKNAQTFGSAVVISLVAYIMLGVYQSYMDTQKQTTDESRRKVEELTAQRLLNNSEARKIKAASGNVQPSTKGVQPSTVHRGQFQANAVQIKEIQDFWKTNLPNNPDLSARQVAKACKCSPTTALKYKP